METIKQDVDQLQEAVAQLMRGTETAARLALVMADNLVELQLHKIARHSLAWGDLLRSGVGSNKRNKVLNDFGKLANYVAQEESQFSEDDRKIASIAHKLRNEAYHRGVVRKGIIGLVARAQLGVASRLLPVATRGWSYSGTSEVEEFFGRFGVRAGADTGNIPKYLAQVCLSICQGTSVTPTELARVLRDDLIARCASVVEAMEYLPSHDGRSPNDRMRWLHAWLVDDEDVHQNDQDVTARLQRIERIAGADPRVVDFGTLAGWGERAERLVDCRTGDAIAEFWELDQMLSPLEEMVQDAGVAYDDMIDGEIKEQRTNL